MSREEIVEAMLGEKAASAIQQPLDVGAAQRPEGARVLEVAHVSGLGVHDVSFAADGGEILGVTGLTGMGQEELAKLIAGALPRKSGRVNVDGAEVAGGSPRALMRRGAVFVPSDRGRLGLWESGSATENLTLPALRRFFRSGVLRGRAEVAHSESLMRQYSVRPVSPGLPVWSFSGGNQQKLLLAKWLQSQPRLVLIAEPTQGVDVAARSEILGVLRRMAAEGSCVTIFSSDHEFLAQACHRVLVMHQGRIGREIAGEGVTEDQLVLSAQRTTAAGAPESAES
jgi:ribose transport system ATP-binding protein